MSDSLIIDINNASWTDITAGSKRGFFTNHSNQYVIYLESLTPPLPAAEKGHRLNPGADKEYSLSGQQRIWAKAIITLDDTATIIVTPNNLAPVDTGLNTTAFGDLKAEAMTPSVQISAEYGLLQNVSTVVDALGSGSVGVLDNKFLSQSGVSSSGLAAILTKKTIRYRSGQGLMARFTALFTVGVSGNRQLAGLITAENSFAFGFIGDQFGIIYTHDGVSENLELTITNPASGSETATITVDGTAYSVPLTVGSIQHNAFEISQSLNAQVTGYDFASNDGQVIALAVINDPGGTFSFSSATAVAGWLQIKAGSLPVTDFVPQENWSEDTFLSVSPDFDPTLGNVYQIQMQYLGFGGIKFFVEDPETADFILVHVIKYANTATLPSVTNPSFRIGWVARNFGNTSNIVVSGSSAAGFIEGKMKINTPYFSADNEAVSITSTPTSIITFRNRLTFGDKRNRSDVLPVSVSISTQSNKSVFIDIISGPNIGGDLDYRYVNKSASIMETAKEAVPVTGGTLIEGITVTEAAPAVINFNWREWHLLTQNPGDIFVISAHISGGAAADVQVVGTWAEDI